MDYVELFFAKLLANVKGYEGKRFVTSPAFAQCSPSIEVTSADCGPSGSEMSVDHTQMGKDLFPTLSWTPVADAAEYLLIVQDVDAPIPMPIMHGLYYGIPPEKTEVVNEDFEPLEGTRISPKGTALRGGFMRGANFRGSVYSGPRALKGHGPHRYFFQVVALSAPLDGEKMSAVPKKGELAKEAEGKVLAWGEWIGASERK